jgi:arsenate reductase
MSNSVIFHNPRCSKSRATLALLEQQQIDFSVVKYLDHPLTASAISQLLAALNMGIREILRTGEADYKEQGFADPKLSDAELINMLSKFPKVMERPIVSHNGQAVVGRPPENVLSLFK